MKDDVEITSREPIGDPIPNYYPAIVEKNLFNQVQRVLQRNAALIGNRGGKNGRISNLFGNLAICGLCCEVIRGE